MPISKDDASAAANDRDAQPYAELCERIDAAIRGRFGTSSPIEVQVRDVRRHLIDRAVREYNALGWKCFVSASDWKEGSFLILS